MSVNKEIYGKGYADAVEAIKKELEKRGLSGKEPPSKDGKSGKDSSGNSGKKGTGSDEAQGGKEGGQNGSQGKKEVPGGANGKEGSPGKATKAVNGSGKGSSGNQKKRNASEVVQDKFGETDSVGGSGGINPGYTHTNMPLGHTFDKDASEYVKEKLKKYKDSMSGIIGEFAKKTRRAKRVKDGVELPVTKANLAWDKELMRAIDAHVKQRVFKMKQITKNTYAKISRRSGIVKLGVPIQPGKRVLDNKMVVKISFYIDRSGSMSVDDNITKAIRCANTIADAIEKKYKREEVISKTMFEFYVFDTSIKEIPRKKYVQANGDNVGFEEIMDYIYKNTSDAMVNVVITDAEFSFDVPKIKKFLEENVEFFVFVTNNQSPEMKSVARSIGDKKLKYIYVGNSFDLSDGKGIDELD